MRAIELADVGRAYGERVALTGVTLAVEEGETLAVFGSNGAGKTTLLRILATLLRPHRGVARVLGRELPKEGWAVRGQVGFLGHEPLLYRDLTARENLQFHARLHDVPFARVDELLDEPLANLDPGGADAVEPLLRGPARVLISHDAEDGLAAADWVLGLRGGRQAIWAPAADVTLADVRGLYR